MRFLMEQDYMLTASNVATEKFDSFTREDFIAHCAKLRSQSRLCDIEQISPKEDGYDPIAWFHVRREQQQCIDLGER